MSEEIKPEAQASKNAKKKVKYKLHIAKN